MYIVAALFQLESVPVIIKGLFVLMWLSLCVVMIIMTLNINFLLTGAIGLGILIFKQENYIYVHKSHLKFFWRWPTCNRCVVRAVAHGTATFCPQRRLGPPSLLSTLPQSH